MKAKNNEKLKAYRALVKLVKDNPERAGRIKAFQEDVMQLDVLLQLVPKLEGKSKASTVGVTKEKVEIRGKLHTEITLLGDVLTSYATRQKDTVLKDKAKNLRTNLNKARQNDLPTVCRNILDEAVLLNGVLLDYGVTADHLAATEVLLEAFSEKSPGTKTLKGIKVSHTQTLKDTFAQIDEMVEHQILTTAAAFQKIDPEFLQQINATASVANLTPSPTMIKVIIKNDMTKLPLSSHPAFLPELNMTKKSNAKGVMMLKVSKGGNYTIEVPKPNGEVHTISNVKVVKGKTTVVKVALSDN